MGNTWGRILRLTTFGESHGPATGGVLEGMPGGIRIDTDLIRRQMERRRPGQSGLTTARREADEVEFLSGIFEGRTLGTPIAFLIRNRDTRSRDYEELKNTYRPSHADWTYEKKFGHRDWRGGGRASARETAARVVGGALAMHLLEGVRIRAGVWAVETIRSDKPWDRLDWDRIDETPVRSADASLTSAFEEAVRRARAEGDTVGGIIIGLIEGLPPGLGEPVFDKFEARLGAAMLSIPAAKGFEIGSGFEGTRMRGSAHNDLFNPDGTTRTNRSGGVQGGITNGMPVWFKVAFKPVATIMRPQPTVDREGRPVVLEPKGRHDPWVLPRAVPVVEAMAALTVADFILLQKTRQ
ncbi:MAG: chorismate synthase [Chlorobi bacterium]|nr:chorismate synthase [Chlorobiota bacterium]